MLPIESETPCITTRITLRDLLQDVARTPARVHEVLGDDLEPVDRRVVFEDVIEVDRAQPYAKSQMPVAQPFIKPADTNQAFFGAAPTVLPAFFIWASNALRAFFQVFSLSGTSQAPCPLQEFCPAYSPQPPWPLHVLSPLQECASAMAHLPVPAQELSPPLPFSLQVLRPRQTCLSCSSSAGSCFSRFRRRALRTYCPGALRQMPPLSVC